MASKKTTKKTRTGMMGALENTHKHPELHVHKHTRALPSPCLSSEGNHTSAWLHRPGSYKIKHTQTDINTHS